MKVRLLALGSTLVMILSSSASRASAAPASCEQTASYPTPPASVDPGAEDTAYIRVITARAGKIVAALDLPDSATFYKVRDIVAGQYYALNAVYTGRDNELKQLKNQSDKKLADSLKQKIQQDVDEKIARLHTAYLGKLATVIRPGQIDQVKDGMTYSVLEVTFHAYLQLWPQLTDEQKGVIFEDLLEAREHAMDAGSSEKKHWWFGKYKGRINNYLSSQGLEKKK
ncbi:MAG TPA: DUF3826 domain-containing protein [Puia sp.]|nr:DUF3826 domain-containing protein [Puia sp.]